MRRGHNVARYPAIWSDGSAERGTSTLRWFLISNRVELRRATQLAFPWRLSISVVVHGIAAGGRCAAVTGARKIKRPAMPTELPFFRLNTARLQVFVTPRFVNSFTTQNASQSAFEGMSHGASVINGSLRYCYQPVLYMVCHRGFIHRLCGAATILSRHAGLATTSFGFPNCGADDGWLSLLCVRKSTFGALDTESEH